MATNPTKQEALEAFNRLDASEGLSSRYYGCGCEHGFKPANSCPTDGCEISQAQNDFNTIHNYLNNVNSETQYYTAQELSDQAKDLIMSSKQSGRIEVVNKNQWLPIESAPKKGRNPIYIWGPNYSEPQKAYPDTWWTAGFSVETQPTLWQPLPLPPETKKKQSPNFRQYFA